MHKKQDLPAIPFYVGDWMKAPDIRALSFEERGFWFDLLCLMWESPERGVLVNQQLKPYTSQELARMSGGDLNLVNMLLNQLKEKGIFSVRKDDAIYCRRMVKDESLRLIRKRVGKLGGNPILLNQKSNQNAEDESEDENENEIKSKVKNEIDLVIKDLNEVCVTNYKTTVDSTRKMISCLLKAGFTLADFKAVHRKKFEEWHREPEWSKYLRPATLYQPKKFEAYLNQPAQGKPIKPREVIETPTRHRPNQPLEASPPPREFLELAKTIGKDVKVGKKEIP